MPPAARITDNHTCPMVNPGPVPHVGGPEISGSPDVITGFMPQGRVGDSLICVPAIDKVAKGSPTVLVNNRQAARLGDSTVHGGVIVTGCPTVIIGESGQSSTLRAAAANGTPFCEECEKAKREQEQKEQAQAPPPNEPPADSIVAQSGGNKPLHKLAAKLDAIVPPARRKKLAQVVQIIKPAAERLLAKGQDERAVASWAVAARQSLAAACDAEFATLGDVVAHVYQRNQKKFGQALGPSADWLMSEKGKKARDIIEAAASGELRGKLAEMAPDLGEQLAGKFTDDPTVQSLVRAAATGDPSAVRAVVVDRIAGELVPNETARDLLAAAAQGELPTKLGDTSGIVVDQFVAKLVPSDEARALLSPAIDVLKGDVADQVAVEVQALLGGGGG